MDALLEIEVFSDFGTDPFFPFSRVPLAAIESQETSELRSLVSQYVPRQPGVYGMVDCLGRLVYVGKSKLLRNRLLSYFLPNHEDEKAGRIIQSAVRIVWEPQPSEFAALLREQQLIRRFRPRFNVQGIPNRQRSVFLCLGRGPAATFYSSSDLDPNAIAWEGPLVGSGRVKRAAELLNRFFLLRDCSNQTRFVFQDQRSLFDLEVRAGCVRYEMQNCLGPCASGCSRGHYQRQVELAKAFLKGEPSDIVERAESKMRLAAERLHFEQAQRFRDDFQVLRWLANRLESHQQVRERFTCVFPVAGYRGRDIWYLIRRGVVEHAVAAPKNQNHYRQAQIVIQRWLANERVVGANFQRREETLAIVASWFRKFPTELTRTIAVQKGLSPPGADMAGSGEPN
jgi:excinuclease ABC subunit C